MPRFAALFAGLVVLALATSFITGCGMSGGSIHTAPLPSATVKLSPNPPTIYIAPFDISNGKWLVGRTNGDQGSIELYNFKRDFQTYFEHQLQERLMKIAPTEQRWVDNLPDHGWLVAGEFVTVYQGSRAERALVGTGLGQTTLQTNVYVYDLDISKTQYVYAFRTGVPDADKDTGAGSGSLPSGVTAPEPILTGLGIGSGLKLDTTRTCREIAATLAPYAAGTVR